LYTVDPKASTQTGDTYKLHDIRIIEKQPFWKIYESSFHSSSTDGEPSKKIKQFTYVLLWKICIRRDPNIKISHYHHVFVNVNTKKYFTYIFKLYIIHHHTTFHMPNSTGSLVTDNKLYVKYSNFIQLQYFTFSMGIISTKVTYFLNTLWTILHSRILPFKQSAWYVNLSTWFMKNVLSEQKEIKFWIKQDFVQNLKWKLCSISEKYNKFPLCLKI
jgi:hypothetical protein